MLRKNGYVSSLGLENCDHMFPGSLGRIPNVDYSVGPFYCAVQQYSAVKFIKKYGVQRCLGGHQTQYYILNYTQTVARMNKGANLWLYTHLNGRWSPFFINKTRNECHNYQLFITIVVPAEFIMWNCFIEVKQ